FFFQAEDGIRDRNVTGVQTCALPIYGYRGETVKAVVSLKNGVSVTAEELIDYGRENMSSYKYPRIVEFMDELPKTNTGKILRRKIGRASCRERATITGDDHRRRSKGR